MPTVLVRDGFRVLVLLPPREHAPAHVHVVKGNGELLVYLSLNGASLEIRENRGMKRADARRAYAIVSANVQLCCDAWEKYHGKD